MRILLTNDDGIDAEGLQVAYDIATQLTKAENVSIVAPASEQSGVGHAITYTETLRFEPRETGVAVFGSPADCVLVGFHEILDSSPDLVLSGVNRGNNAGENALYSGTLGAAMEAALQGVPAIALSQFYGPALQGGDMWSATRAYGLQTVQKILDAGLWSDGDARLFYNVNFPPVFSQDVSGIGFYPQGFRPTRFGTTSVGTGEIKISGGAQAAPSVEGTDVHANLNGMVTITPCSLDLTAHSILDQLRG